MRVRDWTVALSAAALLGTGLGAVYSGVTGWDGPFRRPDAGAVSDAGLPAPSEQASSPGGASPATGVARSAPVPAATEPGRAAKAKVKAPKAKPSTAESRKRKDGKPQKAPV
jgi:hypothetical protein